MKVITLFEIMKLGTFFVPEQIDLYNKDLDSNKSFEDLDAHQFICHFIEITERNLRNKLIKIALREKTINNYEIVEGGKMMVIIVTLVSAVFSTLHNFRSINEKEEIIYKKLVKSELNYKLKLANAENIFFKDYVIDRIEKAIPETIFSKKIQFAFDFFISLLKNKSEKELLTMIEIIKDEEIEVSFCD